MFNGKTILVTGGTGSFGRRFITNLLQTSDPRRVVVLSRDEVKQDELRKTLDADVMRYFIGDVRDAQRLRQAMRGVDLVIHTAALKQVPTAEYNPMECIRTNVDGAANVIDAALSCDVEKVIALSTDKAANPINLYGASKLASDKLFVAANNISGGHRTRFSVVRYGNVVGSRGSVLPFFRALIADGARELPVTDRRMTRFWITLHQGVEFVGECLQRMHGGELFVPKIPSMRIMDLVESLGTGIETREIGIRPGEKLHEVLCPRDDAHLTLEFENHYVIKPSIRFYDLDVDYRRDQLGETGAAVADEFEYSSGTNPVFLDVKQLRTLKRRSGLMIPYGKHSISQEDIEAVVQALKSPRITQGPCIAEFEHALAEFCHAEHAVAVSSGTAALHLACLAVQLGSGDSLWTSPYSFLASANCGLYCGAQVDFVDIDVRTGNLSPDALEIKLASTAGKVATPKVLIPVHFAGAPCDMARIADLARHHDIAIIEDASHALGARLADAPVGNCAHSTMSIFSFHPVKAITTGEGGAITTNDASLAITLRRLREHGMNRDSRSMQGDSHGPWYYEMSELGFNYRINDLQAALGLSQLRRLPEFLADRRRIASRYREELQDLPLDFLDCPVSDDSAHHLFPIRLRLEGPGSSRLDVYRALHQAGIGVQVHYIPIHLQPVYQGLGFSTGNFPAAEALYQSALSLPIYPGLAVEDQDRVIKSLYEILG